MMMRPDKPDGIINPTNIKRVANPPINDVAAAKPVL